MNEQYFGGEKRTSGLRGISVPASRPHSAPRARPCASTGSDETIWKDHALRLRFRAAPAEPGRPVQGSYAAAVGHGLYARVSTKPAWRDARDLRAVVEDTDDEPTLVGWLRLPITRSADEIAAAVRSFRAS